MITQLGEHIRRYTSLHPHELPVLEKYFQPVVLKKRELLFKEGDMVRNQYFVASGCLRMYFLNEKGTEQTTQFALENWWISDYLALGGPSPSAFSLQAIEATEVLALHADQQQLMLREVPVMETYFRNVLQKAVGAAQRRVKYLYGYSREEMFFQFRTLYPDFTQRVPQYMLASFLGITPEYLSELRKKRG